MEQFRMITSLFLFLTLCGVNALVCNYDCLSPYPSLFGQENLTPRGSGLPSHRGRGFNFAAGENICPDTTVTQAKHPVPIASENGLITHFVALCSRSLKIFEVPYPDTEFLVKSEVEISDATVGFSLVGNQIAVLTASSVEFYEVADLVTGEVNKLWSKSGSFSGVPAISLTHVHVFSGTSLTSFAISDGSSSTVETGFENSLGYGVITDGNVAFCSSSGVHLVSGGATSTVSLSDSGLTCSNLVVSDSGVLTFAADSSSGSAIGQISTSDFNGFSVYASFPETISGISKSGFSHATRGKVGLIVATTDSGVMTVIESDKGREKGSLYAKFDWTSAAVGKPTVTSLGEPIVFTETGVVAFTSTHTVKFFGVKEGKSYVPNPMLLSQDRLVAFGENGSAELYSWCNRYKLGDEEPEDACPVADLPEEAEVPTWMTIVAGAGAVIAIPFLGEYVCIKMKVRGSSETERENEEEFEEEEDEKVIQSLTPVRRQ